MKALLSENRLLCQDSNQGLQVQKRKRYPCTEFTVQPPVIKDHDVLESLDQDLAISKIDPIKVVPVYFCFAILRYGNSDPERMSKVYFLTNELA